VTPLGELSIRWTGTEDAEIEITDEFDGAPPEEEPQSGPEPVTEPHAEPEPGAADPALGDSPEEDA
jgi:segregation and condensation protein A